MPNNFNLGGDQVVAIEFARDPSADDFKKLIAILELQRALIAGDPIEFEITVSAKAKWSKPQSVTKEDIAPAFLCAKCSRPANHPVHRDQGGHRFFDPAWHPTDCNCVRCVETVVE